MNAPHPLHLACALALFMTAGAARAEPSSKPVGPMRAVVVPAPGVDQPAPMVRTDNDPTMTAWGMGLTLSGLGAMGLGGGVLVVSIATAKDFGAIIGVIAGGTIGGTGALASLVGVPLWIAGEYDIEVPAEGVRAHERRTRLPPSVRVGPAGIDLTWRF